MADYIRKTGDTQHIYTATLTDKNGPADLPVGSSVVFSARKTGDTLPTVQGAGQIVKPGAGIGDVDRGKVTFDMIATASGVYNVDWTVTLPGGLIQRFPEDGFLLLVVLENAG